MVEVFVRWNTGEVTNVRAWHLPRVPVFGELLLLEESQTWLRVYQVMFTDEKTTVLASLVYDPSGYAASFGMEVEVETT